MKKTTLLFSTIVAGFLVSGCQQQNQLEGTWLQPVPGQENKTQGFTLEKNGKASSVNMETLKYDSWSTSNGNRLILNGKSIGNGQTIDFSDTMEIESADSKTLVLKQGDTRLTYTRQD